MAVRIVDTKSSTIFCNYPTIQMVTWLQPPIIAKSARSAKILFTRTMSFKHASYHVLITNLRGGWLVEVMVNTVAVDSQGATSRDWQAQAESSKGAITSVVAACAVLRQHWLAHLPPCTISRPHRWCPPWCKARYYSYFIQRWQSHCFSTWNNQGIFGFEIFLLIRVEFLVMDSCSRAVVFLLDKLNLIG